VPRHFANIQTTDRQNSTSNLQTTKMWTLIETLLDWLSCNTCDGLSGGYIYIYLYITSVTLKCCHCLVWPTFWNSGIWVSASKRGTANVAEGAKLESECFKSYGKNEKTLSHAHVGADVLVAGLLLLVELVLASLEGQRIVQNLELVCTDISSLKTRIFVPCRNSPRINHSKNIPMFFLPMKYIDSFLKAFFLVTHFSSTLAVSQRRCPCSHFGKALHSNRICFMCILKRKNGGKCRLNHWYAPMTWHRVRVAVQLILHFVTRNAHL
jgi:hypothetical protein